MLTLWIGLVILTLLAVSFVVVPLFKTSKALAVSLIVFIPALALVGYLHWGSLPALASYERGQAMQPKIAAFRKKFDTPDKVIQEFKAVLKADPNQPEGWFLLGRVYSSAGQYQKAKETFTKAVQLKPKVVKYQLSLIESSFFANKSSFDKQTKAQVNDLLKQYPKQPTLLNLLALDSYQRQHYTKALAYWQQLSPLLDPASQDGQALIEAIVDTKAKLKASTGPGPSISVKVDVPLTLKNKFAATTTTFIYAKAVDGPPMPLALIKLTIGELPKTVILDDSTSMIASVNLSHFNKIRVFARISPTGSAEPRQGDWQAISNLLDLSKPQKAVILTIDKPL